MRKATYTTNKITPNSMVYSFEHDMSGLKVMIYTDTPAYLRSPNCPVAYDPTTDLETVVIKDNETQLPVCVSSHMQAIDKGDKEKPKYVLHIFMTDSAGVWDVLDSISYDIGSIIWCDPIESTANTGQVVEDFLGGHYQGFYRMSYDIADKIISTVYMHNQTSN